MYELFVKYVNQVSSTTATSRVVDDDDDFSFASSTLADSSFGAANATETRIPKRKMTWRNFPIFRKKFRNFGTLCRVWSEGWRGIEEGSGWQAWFYMEETSLFKGQASQPGSDAGTDFIF